MQLTSYFAPFSKYRQQTFGQIFAVDMWSTPVLGELRNQAWGILRRLSILFCKPYFEILNRLGVDYQCDWRTKLRWQQRRAETAWKREAHEVGPEDKAPAVCMCVGRSVIVRQAVRLLGSTCRQTMAIMQRYYCWDWDLRMISVNMRIDLASVSCA